MSLIGLEKKFSECKQNVIGARNGELQCQVSPKAKRTEWEAKNVTALPFRTLGKVLQERGEGEGGNTQAKMTSCCNKEVSVLDYPQKFISVWKN